LAGRTFAIFALACRKYDVLKRKVTDKIKQLSMGDLVRVEWCDASVGKSLRVGKDVDVPVSSWGIFIGILGERNKHIILAQNNFKYTDGLCDLDYTAIPLHWSVDVLMIAKKHVPSREAKVLLNSFLMGGRRTIANRRRQRHVENHHHD
jgi:hypothetical protein